MQVDHVLRTHQCSRGMSTGSDIEFMYMESLQAIGATTARRKQKVLGPVCGWFDQRGKHHDPVPTLRTAPVIANRLMTSPKKNRPGNRHVVHVNNHSYARDRMETVCRRCGDRMEIHLRHPLDTDATRQETAAARIAKRTSRHAHLRARVSRHHMPHCREDLARRAYRDLRGLLGWKQLDQQVEGDLPVDLADLEVTDIRDDVVPDHIAVFLARSDSPRGMQEALFAELRDRHLGLPIGSARRGDRTTGVTFKLQARLGGRCARSGLGQSERGVVAGHRLVGVLDGAQPGGDPGLAGGDGLAVAPAAGAFGQVGAVLFDFADVGFALVGVRGDGEDGGVGGGGYLELGRLPGL
jgi:hypothetical protein